jgi:hypothetical protein
MKRKIPIVLTVGFMVSLCTLAILAQTEEQKSKLYFVEEAAVKPSMLSEHEAAIKEMVGFSSEHKYPYPWYAYNTDDFHYYYVFAVENLSEIENVFKAWGEVMKKLPNEQLQALMKNYQSTYEYAKYFMFRHRLDLSYTPESPRLKPGEANFTYWGFCYLLPGKEKEFEKICREFAVLDKSNNRPDGWNTYVGDIGMDMPLYFWTMHMKNAADFWNQDEINTKKVGEEKVMELWKRTLAMCRKYEYKTGWFRPDLSYLPKDK